MAIRGVCLILGKQTYICHVKLVVMFVLSSGARDELPSWSRGWSVLLVGLFVCVLWFVQHIGELWYAPFRQNRRAPCEGGATCTLSPGSTVDVLRQRNENRPKTVYQDFICP